MHANSGELTPNVSARGSEYDVSHDTEPAITACGHSARDAGKLVRSVCFFLVILDTKRRVDLCQHLLALALPAAE